MMYFPEVWMSLHAALSNGEYNDIPGVLVNGWSSGWKKVLFSLMYYKNWYLLYPGYEQVGAVTAGRLCDGNFSLGLHRCV